MVDQYVPYLITGFLLPIAVWAIKEIFTNKKKALEKHTDATLQNTMALMELKIEMKYIRLALEELPKLRQDVNAAHEKIRSMRP